MRLNRRKHKPGVPELNLAAMIDVVFLLLIFFMCTTSFQNIEHKLAAQLPQFTQQPIQMEDFEPIHIALRVVEGKVQIVCDQQVCENYNDLVQMVQARLVVPDVPALISGSEDVPFDAMARALDACHQAGMIRVAYSTQQR